MAKAILRLPIVKARTGLSRSSIYLRTKEGRFPAKITLGPNSVGWLEEEIENWITSQVNASRGSKIVRSSAR